jgi:hypothetical protein
MIKEEKINAEMPIDSRKMFSIFLMKVMFVSQKGEKQKVSLTSSQSMAQSQFSSLT